MLEDRARIIVTGANGFIGAALVAHFRTNADVLAVDRAWTQPAAGGEPRTSIDLTQPLPDAPELVDTSVVHAAGNSSTEDRQTLWDLNVTATFNVFEWAVRHATRHVVLFSTAEVYDPSAPGPHAEDAPLAPSGFVGHSKRLCEQIGAVYWREFALPVTVLRLFFPYGPGQAHGRLPQLAAARADGAPLPPPLGQLCAANPVHRDDCVAAVAAVCRAPQGYRVYNVCGDETLALPRGGDWRLLGDNSRLKADCGWQPERTRAAPPGLA